MKFGPFQIEILQGKTKTQLGKSAHVMVVPLKAGLSGVGQDLFHLVCMFSMPI